jgi:methionyl aminopeptidase
MIQLKNRAEIAGIKDSCVILTDAFHVLKELIAPGITTGELNRRAHDYIMQRGARPSFLGYMGYPASICVSINEEVIHGIPGKRRLEEGDIVSLDLGVEYKHYYSDMAYTCPIGAVSPGRQKLVQVTRECLELGAAQGICGNRIHDISRAIYEHATSNGFGVVRQYCGHGVGFAMHEDPQIPNYVGEGPNPRLKAGMVIAVEPMINGGTWEVKVLGDDWTVVTKDRSDSAHFEYTLAVLKERTEILTPFD